VVSLLDLTTWGEGGQELIILIFLDLILCEATSSSLRFGSNLGCVDVSCFLQRGGSIPLVWCLVSKDREFLVNSWDWEGMA
jgi:hypothetical protein